MKKRIVIKIGTGVLTDSIGKLDQKTIANIVSQISALQTNGMEVLIVSSGSIGAGMGVLNKKKRPSELCELQAMASLGQVHLMDIYNRYFKRRKHLTGQILLTQEDFNNRQRYLNIKETINALLLHKVIPIINENDTVSTQEIKCGDNDRISALVSDLCNADMLIILTTVDGLMDKEQKVVSCVENIDSSIKALIRDEGSAFGTGGMLTKLASAEFAVNAGIDCYFANGKKKGKILKIFDKKAGVYTHFKAKDINLKAKKRWIGFGSKTKGEIVVDKGAEKALIKDNKSLLAAGIIECIGNFSCADILSIKDIKGDEIARGLANYSSLEINRIKGAKTSEIIKILGYKNHDSVIHKDNLVIM